MTVGVLIGPAVAQAAWPTGLNECKFGEGFHCYALAEHNVKAIASIVFIRDTAANVPEWKTGRFTSHEQWISFGSETEWVETGDITGYEFSCCSPHPFFAEQQKGSFKIQLSPGVVPPSEYNHYILDDAERNGIFRVYWNCCEVGSYAGWPEKFSTQEAGVEADSGSEPGSYERQMTAWSEGGEWFPWTGATWYKNEGLCVKANVEGSAPGNIEGGTKKGASETGVSCS